MECPGFRRSFVVGLLIATAAGSAQLLGMWTILRGLLPLDIPPPSVLALVMLGRGVLTGVLAGLAGGRWSRAAGEGAAAGFLAATIGITLALGILWTTEAAATRQTGVEVLDPQFFRNLSIVFAPGAIMGALAGAVAPRKHVVPVFDGPRYQVRPKAKPPQYVVGVSTRIPGDHDA